MAKNLFILSHHYDSELYRQTAQQMLKNILPEMAQYPNSFSNWLDLLQNYRFKFYEVVVVGENAPKKVAEINRNYLPHILISGSPKVPVKMPLLEERYARDTAGRRAEAMQLRRPEHCVNFARLRPAKTPKFATTPKHKHAHVDLMTGLRRSMGAAVSF